MGGGISNGLAASFAEEDNLDGLKEDADFEEEGHVLDVEQIVLELFNRIPYGSSIMIIHLRPPRNTGFDRMSKGIIGNPFFQLSYKLGPFRPRADEAHLLLKNIDQLRNFIQTGSS